MLTCREMSELSSDIMEGRLSLRSRWAVFMHLRMCPRCKLYLKQLQLTSEVLQKLPLADGQVDSSAIIQRLRKADD
ncbi:zf-HC2 domain-containing protein [Pseudomonas sp. CAU 1711]|uniref:zf-HC2 domain-containing protein n=1 Tax=Pseudomonas sp. CAU 1711 TaxID=3140356 RepID=UPI0032609AD7